MKHDERADLSAYRVANTRILVAQSRTLLAVWKALKPQSEARKSASAASLGKSRRILSPQST
jgi:hypothetical protein